MLAVLSLRVGRKKEICIDWVVIQCVTSLLCYKVRACVCVCDHAIKVYVMYLVNMCYVTCHHMYLKMNLSTRAHTPGFHTGLFTVCTLPHPFLNSYYFDAHVYMRVYTSQ